MKLLLSILIISFCIIQHSNAQLQIKLSDNSNATELQYYNNNGGALTLGAKILTITDNQIGIQSNNDFYINNYSVGNGNVWLGKTGLGTTSVMNNFNVAGNVGIGISPSYKLHILATEHSSYSPTVFPISDFVLDAGASQGSYTSLCLISRSPYNNDASGITIANIPTGNGNSEIAFGTRSNYEHTEKIRINKDGNIGIGTNTPQTNIHIKYTSTNPQAILRLESPSVNSNASVQYMSGGTLKWELGTGISSNSNFELFDRINGISRIVVDANGYLGVGTIQPKGQLHLASDQNHSFDISRKDGTYGFRILRNANEGNFYFQIGTSLNTWETKIKIGEGEGPGTKLIFNPDGGNVLIGKTTQTSTGVRYKLDVAGPMRADEVVVNTTGADFVFAPTYNLRPLAEVEQYVNEHKHLPEIAPAAEMKANGVNVSEMQTKLLQKVEELTLYVIEQQKQIEAQNEEIEKLRNEIKLK